MAWRFGVEIAEFLYLRSGALTHPVAICQAVAEFYTGDGWHPVTDDELDRVVWESESVLNRRLFHGRSLGAKWDWGIYCGVVEHARYDRDTLGVTELTRAIRVCIDLREWRMANRGFDLFAEPRAGGSTWSAAS